MNARPWLKILGFELVVLALIVLGIVGLIRGASEPDGAVAMAEPPVVTVELSNVTSAIADDYRAAADRIEPAPRQLIQRAACPQFGQFDAVR